MRTIKQGLNSVEKARQALDFVDEDRRGCRDRAETLLELPGIAQEVQVRGFVREVVLSPGFR